MNDPTKQHRPVAEIDAAIALQRRVRDEVSKYKIAESMRREQAILDALLEERFAATT